MQRPGHEVEPSVFKESQVGGLAESKDESGLKVNDWVHESGIYRPYKPHERV